MPIIVVDPEKETYTSAAAWLAGLDARYNSGWTAASTWTERRWFFWRRIVVAYVKPVVAAQ